MQLDQLDIDPELSSVRLFFAKESELSLVWHLCDAALGHSDNHGKVLFTALHGTVIHAAVRCDTVLQTQLRQTEQDYFCVRCLEEYELAREVIEERRLMSWQ